MLSSRTVAVFLLMTPLVPSVLAQRSESTASLLLRFDNEHDLAAKEHLLLTVTNKDAGRATVAPTRGSTTNSDTRWMAMRGMATLRYTDCAPFLEASLKDSDALVRSNAARAWEISASGTRPPRCWPCSPLSRTQRRFNKHLPHSRCLTSRQPCRSSGKTPCFHRQTREWLIGALGMLGSIRDVPLIAGYLDDDVSGMAATEAIRSWPA